LSFAAVRKLNGAITKIAWWSVAKQSEFTSGSDYFSNKRYLNP